jgi:Protein HRI1
MKCPIGRVTFLHTINSRNTFQHIDTGLFTAMPNGDELEVGTTIRPGDPAGSFPRQYEEVWRPRKLIHVPGSNIAWILEGAGSHISLTQNADGVGTEESKEVETFLARIGGVYIAVRQPTRIVGTPQMNGEYSFQKFGDVEGVSIRHEEFAGKRGWVEKFVTGPEGKELPTMQKNKSDFVPAQEGKGNWRKPSQKVTIRGEDYVVRGFTDLSP